VLFFGVLRDSFGGPDEVAELPDGATVGELLGLLRGRTSKDLMDEGKRSSDEQLWRSLAVAVNREYGSTSIVLREGDEVALLPPVSGGSFVEGEKPASRARAASPHRVRVGVVSVIERKRVRC
jgi:molybdopterin converting factor small subunit